jgi:uncharacterized protein YndB with AHSA1/START domain
MPTAQHGRASIEIAAPPQAVYDLIADVTRMGEWSPECYRCEWLDGASAATPGARFRGYNRIGRFRWERTALICTAERGRKFTFETIDDRTHRHETRWQYAMEPSGSGTVLTESFQFLWCSLRNRATEMVPSPWPPGKSRNRRDAKAHQARGRSASRGGLFVISRSRSPPHRQCDQPPD